MEEHGSRRYYSYRKIVSNHVNMNCMSVQISKNDWQNWLGLMIDIEDDDCYIEIVLFVPISKMTIYLNGKHQDSRDKYDRCDMISYQL